MSSLRSSAIPLTAMHVSNVCRGITWIGSERERETGKRGRREEMKRKDATWLASKEELPGTSFLWHARLPQVRHKVRRMIPL